MTLTFAVRLKTFWKEPEPHFQKQKYTEEEVPLSGIKWTVKPPFTGVTCWLLCQSAVDPADDSVCRHSREPLYVQTIKSATVLTDLGSERRHTKLKRKYWSFKTAYFNILTRWNLNWRLRFSSLCNIFHCFYAITLTENMTYTLYGDSSNNASILQLHLNCLVLNPLPYE